METRHAKGSDLTRNSSSEPKALKTLTFVVHWLLKTETFLDHFTVILSTSGTVKIEILDVSRGSWLAHRQYLTVAPILAF